MSETIDNIVLEHLKKISSEQKASRDRDAKILSTLAEIESSIACLVR